MSWIRERKMPDGKKRYYPGAIVEGKETSLGGFPTMKAAKAALKEAERQIDNGTFGKKVGPTPTFEELAHKWLDEVARHKVKASTLARYTHDVDAHLCPEFGEAELANITAIKIQSFVSEKLDAGSSPRTVNSMIKVTALIMKWAVKHNYIEKNPVLDVERPKITEKEMEFLNVDEVKRLLVACKALDDEQTERFAEILKKRELPGYRRTVEDLKRPGPTFIPIYPIVATAILTGMRQGELLALKWGDFDPERGVIFVRRTWSPTYGEGEPKSKMSKRAIFAPDVVDILKAQREVSIYDGQDDLIFPNHKGKHLDYHNVTHRVFETALDDAEIRHIRFHDLRHTYAALELSRNINIKRLQKQMGHSSISITLDTYGHLYPDVDEADGGGLGALLFDKKVVPFKKTSGE